jgi:hypothetical protein
MEPNVKFLLNNATNATIKQLKLKELRLKEFTNFRMIEMEKRREVRNRPESYLIQFLPILSQTRFNGVRVLESGSDKL